LDWKASGLSISAFCRTRDVTEASFYYWRRELADRGHRGGQGDATPISVTEPAFVPVRVVATEPIEVVVRSGQILRVGTAFDPSHLRAVVSALER
jgi:transposase-like protein